MLLYVVIQDYQHIKGTSNSNVSNKRKQHKLAQPRKQRPTENKDARTIIMSGGAKLHEDDLELHQTERKGSRDDKSVPYPK